MAGASLVLPGPKLDPASLHRLIEEEGVTFSAGVPTIWTALLNWLRADPTRRFANPPPFFGLAPRARGARGRGLPRAGLPSAGLGARALWVPPRRPNGPADAA